MAPLVGLLVRALSSERVAEAIARLVGRMLDAKLGDQTEELSRRVELLHGENMARFEELEHGLGRVGVHVRQLESRIKLLEAEAFGKLDDPAEPGEE